MALAPNIALCADIGPPLRSAGLPKVVTATTLLAYWGGSALPQLMPPTGTPLTMSITDAPCEYPPSTCGVFGHLSATSLMCLMASLAPSPPCSCSRLAL
jgi:hypothetical protein